MDAVEWVLFLFLNGLLLCGAQKSHCDNHLVPLITALDTLQQQQQQHA
jgi:hypothetical protein